VGAVALREEPAGPLAEHAGERHGRHVDERDLHAQDAGGRGDLGAHEPGPHDRDAVGAVERTAELLGVCGGPQSEHARQGGARERARAGAGGDHQRVRGRPAREGAPVEVEPLDAPAEHELDLPLLPVVVGPELDALLLAGQELLRERGPLVRRACLVADEEDAAVEALGPQGLRAARACQARADDHHRARGHAARSPDSAS
jgi:hypothetical protein